MGARIRDSRRQAPPRAISTSPDEEKVEAPEQEKASQAADPAGRPCSYADSGARPNPAPKAAQTIVRSVQSVRTVRAPAAEVPNPHADVVVAKRVANL